MNQNYKMSEIDEELIKEGFVKPEEIEGAYAIREKKRQQGKVPLALCFLNQGLVSKDCITTLLARPEIQKKIGVAAQKKGLISHRQLMNCMDDSNTQHQVGVMMVTKEYISNKDLKQLSYEQLDAISFGKLMLKHKLINENDLKKVLSIKNYNESICEILYHKNLISLSELNHVCRKFDNELKLGKILFLQEVVNKDALDAALNEQRNSFESLGKILIKRKLLRIKELYFALSIQYNTPFQDLKGFVYYEKQKIELRNIVGQRYAEENLIIPLFINGNDLTLAVSNPANIWSMHGLTPLHQSLKMKCVLITDEKFEQLYAALYGEILKIPVSSAMSRKDAIVSNERTVISNPKMQRWLIRKLYSRYKLHREDTGEILTASEEVLFHRFVKESYGQISREYNCNRVSFGFEIKNDRIQLLASPML